MKKPPSAKIIKLMPEISGVESGVPMPTLVGVDSRSKYPFDLLAVGDSFTVAKDKILSCRQLVYSRNRHGVKEFVTKLEGNRLRVWRVK